MTATIGWNCGWHSRPARRSRSSVSSMTRIACCQTDPVMADLAANTEIITAQIAEAVGAGAHIVVLPELATSGYMFADADEARSLALTADSPQFAQWVAALGDSVAIFGFCE